jgi:hypothetical protein
LGLFQSDVNVLWDLAVHDLSIMSYVLDQAPGSRCPRRATAICPTSRICGVPDRILRRRHDRPHQRQLAVAREDPATLVGGGNQNDRVRRPIETSEKIKLYDKGITVTETPEDRPQAADRLPDR